MSDHPDTTTTTHDVGDPHAAGGHQDEAGHPHDEHASASLGPIDWAAWGAGILGIVAGLLTAACIYLATGPH